jgi:trans-aconitate 2-methyltransferase
MEQSNNHYTFGTSDLAAQRLAFLAKAYEAPSRAFLSEWRPATVEHAIDLGCGPGYTTELVCSAVQPRRMTGLDASEKLLGEARQRLSSKLSIDWICHDITTAPFPCAAADFLFCRFLVTHLHDATAALRAWATAAQPGACLLIQETAQLESDDAVMSRYYDMVGRLQAAYGQALHIGQKLDGCLDGTPWSLCASTCRAVEQPAAIMARLHAMNIRTWSSDAKAATLFSADDVATVQSELDRIASGERSAGPVRNTLREIVASVP